MGIQINGNTNNINAGIGSLSIEDLNELDIVGVATASNFKTGSSNLHSTGLTVGNNFLHSTGINVGTGATIHVPSSNVLTLGTNSNERIRIKSDGYVGVNETNPQYPLHVSGATTDPSPDGTGILMGLQHDHAVIHLNAADTKGCLIDFSVPNTDRKGGILYYHSNNPTAGNRDAMLFYTNGQNERLRITSTGKVGINSTSPTYALEVDGGTQNTVIAARSSDAKAAISFLDNTTGGYGRATIGGEGTEVYITSGTGGDERLRIDSTGRLLVNTTTGFAGDNTMIISGESPSGGTYDLYDGQLLITSNETSGAVNTGGVIQFYGHDGGNSRGFGSIRCLKENGTSGNHNAYMAFLLRVNGGNPTERLRITSDGKIGIGENNPTRKLDVSGDVLGVAFMLRSNSTASPSIQAQMFRPADNTLAFATNGNNERLRIDSSGRVVIGGTNAYIGGAALAVLGTGTTPNTYGSFAIGKVGANPTAGTTLANIRLNGGSVGTRRGAEINAVANGNWTDGSSHPTKLVFAVANTNSASATQRFEINHYGHHVFTNENVLPSSGSPGTNGFKGLTQLGYQHWGQRQYYSGQRNMAQNDTFDLFSNNTAHDDIIFWLNIKGFHANRTFATAHGTIGGYGLSVAYQSATGVYGNFSATNIGSGRNALRWTSTSPYGANWWIWGWYSGTSGTGTHTGWSAAQLH